MLRHTFILAGLAVLTAGCASISKDSCVAGSWESLGYEDGRNGESRGQFNKIAKTCAKYGISANSMDYLTGYEAGIGQYCSYDRGYSHGVSGDGLKPECREINATPYLEGYNTGLPLYCSFDRGFDHGESGKAAKERCLQINSIEYLEGHDEGRTLYALRSEYDNMIAAYDDRRLALEDISYRLSNSELEPSERTRLRKKARRLELELDDVRIDIRAFERLNDWPKQRLAVPQYYRS